MQGTSDSDNMAQIHVFPTPFCYAQLYILKMTQKSNMKKALRDGGKHKKS